MIYGLSPAGQGVLELVTRLGEDAHINDQPPRGGEDRGDA
jgi:hypothetical protein